MPREGGRQSRRELDRARIEARLGYRASAVDVSASPDGSRRVRLGWRDGALAAAALVAAAAPLAAPTLPTETRVALSWDAAIEEAGAVETASVPAGLALPAGLTAARAEPGRTPFWAEVMMDRQTPAEPVALEPADLATAAIRPDSGAPMDPTAAIEVGGPAPIAAASAPMAARPADDFAEITTGVVLDGPIGSAAPYGVATAPVDPYLEGEGPLTFPTATIGDAPIMLQDAPPPYRSQPLQEIPMFGPGASPFELDRGERESLGLFDTGAIPAPSAPATTEALGPRVDAQPPQRDATHAAPLLDILTRAALGGGAMLRGLEPRAEAVAMAIDEAMTHIPMAPRASRSRTSAAATTADAPESQPANDALGHEQGRIAPDAIASRATTESEAAADATGEALVESSDPSIFDGEDEEVATASLPAEAVASNGYAPDFAPRPRPDPRFMPAISAHRVAPAPAPRPEVDGDAGSDQTAAAAADAAFGSFDEVEKPAAAPKPRPAISLVLTAVGLNTRASVAAIGDLPSAVAVAIAPIASESVAWSNRAKASGRLVLADTPLEPGDYPKSNPGPLTLLTTNSVAENVRLLGETLDRVPDASGIATYRGGRFAVNDTAAAMLAASLQRRGLMLLETSTDPGRKLTRTAAALGVPAFDAAVLIDESGHARSLDPGLAQLEAAAKRDGYAIGVGVAIPNTVEALTAWAKTLDERGFDLLPLGPRELRQPMDAVAQTLD